ncbi:MAG: serine/threonine-protein kinase [Candidatus Eremiobacterota bacterium]
MALETGTILNNIYRVVRLLGSGAMGNVYLVERIEDDRRFVIKELIFSKACGIDSEMAKEIFFREAEFMVKFKHPGMPKTYGIFTDKELNYLTMDYIEGKTLEEILNSSEKPLTEEKAIKWIGELCEILDYLHNGFNVPVVYRDLKPSNIIITPDEKVKLVDFGIARLYNPDKNTDTFSYGSPGYAAPEQYRGRGQSSPQSDVYGLGVILFQMLTLYDPSVKPFTFPSVKTLNSSVKPGLEEIIRHAIEMEPLKRYISVKDFRDSLLKYTGINKISSEKSGGAGRTEIYKLAGLFIFSLCIILFFFNPVHSNRFFALYAAGQIAFLVVLSAIITLFLLGIITLIIDIKKRKASLNSVIMLLTLLSLVIVNILPDFYSMDHLTRSLCTIGWAFIIWVFIKSYIYIIYSVINSSDVVRTTFITLVIAWCIYLGFLIFEFFQVVIFMFLTVPFIWSLFHLVYLFCHRILSIKNPGKDPVKSFFLPASAMFLFFILAFFAILLPNFLGTRGSGQLAACESNIKNLATALEMYATDNNGDYPPSLEYLTKITDTDPGSSYVNSQPMYSKDNKGNYPPSRDYLVTITDSESGTGYIKSLPLCPSSNLTYSYSVNNNIPTFTLWCTEKNSHIYADLPYNRCYPQYAPGSGLIVGY